MTDAKSASPHERLRALRRSLPDDLPAPLAESLERHRHNLLTLTASMRAAGLDEPAVMRAVEALVASYSTELLGAFRTLTEDTR